MKKTILALAIFSSLAQAECVQHSVTQINSQHRIGEPVDLIKSYSSGACVVGYQIEVDGEVHTVLHKQQGNGTEAELCQQAVVASREQLLSKLGGKVTGESITVCGDAEVPTLKMNYRPVKIGDLVLENELPRVPEYPNMFIWNKSQCRLFRERYTMAGKFRVTQGTMCKTDQQQWAVVDKW